MPCPLTPQLCSALSGTRWVKLQECRVEALHHFVWWLVNVDWWDLLLFSGLDQKTCHMVTAGSVHCVCLTGMILLGKCGNKLHSCYECLNLDFALRFGVKSLAKYLKTRPELSLQRTLKVQFKKGLLISRWNVFLFCCQGTVICLCGDATSTASLAPRSHSCPLPLSWSDCCWVVRKLFMPGAAGRTLLLKQVKQCYTYTLFLLRPYSWFSTQRLSYVNIVITICFRDWESVHMGQRRLWTTGPRSSDQSEPRAAAVGGSFSRRWKPPCRG